MNTFEENMNTFILQYCKYIEFKKKKLNDNNFKLIKIDLMTKLIKITNYILGDNGIFIRKFSKFVSENDKHKKITVSICLSILLDEEISPNFDFGDIMLLDLKFRFLILFYIIFNFIIEPNDKLPSFQILPSLNQCIYEFRTRGRCPSCKNYMIGNEYELNNNFYCNHCYHKHIIKHFLPEYERHFLPEYEKHFLPEYERQVSLLPPKS
jgi:hypothetical protein